jgi:hypothetical protein
MTKSAKYRVKSNASRLARDNKEFLSAHNDYYKRDTNQKQAKKEIARALSLTAAGKNP